MKMRGCCCYVQQDDQDTTTKGDVDGSLMFVVRHNVYILRYVAI